MGGDGLFCWGVVCSAHFDRVVLEVTSVVENQLPTKLVTQKEGLKEGSRKEFMVPMEVECSNIAWPGFECTPS
jgi:hypothetical protein